MGDFFGGGGGEAAPPGYFETPPNPAGNIPNTDTLNSIAANLLGPTSHWLSHGNAMGYRTIDYGHGDYNPQTMAMHIPAFNPAAQQNNPWIQPPGLMQFPLGAYSYVPPGANSMFNPQGNYGMSNGMQGIPPFNPQMAQVMPDFNGPFGPGGQQMAQQQPQGQAGGGGGNSSSPKEGSKPDKKGTE